jgi:hypothetical protein
MGRSDVLEEKHLGMISKHELRAYVEWKLLPVWKGFNFMRGR